MFALPSAPALARGGDVTPPSLPFPPRQEYTFARRSYHEFRSAHPELPAVARGRKVHEQCAKWAVQCVELGVRPALVLRLLREEGLDEEKNPALVRRLQDPTGRALGAVVSRSQVDPVAAARRGDHEALHWFVTGGLDVNEPSGGELLLATAAHEGHIATVNVLLQHGAQVWLPDSHGRTPLLRAVGAGSVPMVELLNYYGSPVVTRDNAGSTVLHAASAAGSAPLLRWLAGFQRDRVVDLTSVRPSSPRRRPCRAVGGGHAHAHAPTPARRHSRRGLSAAWRRCTTHMCRRGWAHSPGQSFTPTGSGTLFRSCTRPAPCT